ncbi:hypothetical protein Tco_0552766 [Tanacetum coccineum]
MSIMMLRPQTRVSVQAPFGGVVDWYPEPGLWQLCPTRGGDDYSFLTARVLDLDTYSSSKADLLESSPPSVYVTPMVLPFLCSDDSESDTEIPERHVSPKPHDAMLTRWRSRVASRSSSPTTSTSEIPTAPILPAPSAIFTPSSDFPLAPIVDPLRIH